jgi:beta-phosphoglucomutase-like phosphatase (HAD superfamily)
MKLKLPCRLFAAYLFDCDGTIANSMPLHYIAWKKALESGVATLRKDLLFLGWHACREIVATLNKDRGLAMPVETVAHRKESLYLELLPQLKGIPEVPEHVDARHGQIPFAVVSGSALDSVTASLSTEPSRPVRHVGVCSRLREKQAQSGSLSARSYAAWLAA